jgi:ankyrin repeat protein
VDIIKLLLDKGMSVNVTNSNDATPLHVSAEIGNLDATEPLVETGVAIINTNVDGDTPPIEGAYKGKSEIFRYLRVIALMLILAATITTLYFI